MAVLILVVFALITLPLTAYSLYLARRVCCPHCYHEGEEVSMIPIGGPFLWFCMVCENRFSYQEAMRTQLYEEEELEREQLALGPGRSEDQDW